MVSSSLAPKMSGGDNLNASPDHEPEIDNAILSDAFAERWTVASRLSNSPSILDIDQQKLRGQ